MGAIAAAAAAGGGGGGRSKSWDLVRERVGVVRRGRLERRVEEEEEDDEEEEGADEVASARFRLRVSIQNLTAPVGWVAGVYSGDQDLIRRMKASTLIRNLPDRCF